MGIFTTLQYTAFFTKRKAKSMFQRKLRERSFWCIILPTPPICGAKKERLEMKEIFVKELRKDMEITEFFMVKSIGIKTGANGK